MQRPPATVRVDSDPPKVSDVLERWLGQEGPRTLGELVEVFGERSFAVVFVVLLSLPALPLPTGGVTQVFEVTAMVVAVQLVVGRRSIWLPDRWRRIDLRGRTGARLTGSLVRRLRWFERFARRRLPSLTRGRAARTLFGLLALIFTVASFLAPPFSGLDTLPALGVVIMSLGVLLGDFAFVAAGTVIGWLGVASVIGFGALMVEMVSDLL
jgi:hypothetical protein